MWLCLYPNYLSWSKWSLVSLAIYPELNLIFQLRAISWVISRVMLTDWLKEGWSFEKFQIQTLLWSDHDVVFVPQILIPKQVQNLC